MTENGVPLVILDFGSQFTQLIAREVRDQGVYCEIVPYSIRLKDLLAKNPKALVLSGGPSSVRGGPKVMKDILGLNLPVLGICYGMQLLSHLHRGKVTSGNSREYGFCEIEVMSASGLFSNFNLKEKYAVWMSHGDSVEQVPAGAKITAKSQSCPVVAYEMGNLHGVQFHPEVHHTPIGKKIIGNFLFRIAGLKADWKMENFFEVKSKQILELVGSAEVIGAVSGGVDSTVLAVFLAKILGKRFHPFMIDTGLLRANEAKEVTQFLRGIGVPLRVVNASKLFLSRLKGVADPEKKRRIIGKTFIDVFQKECRHSKRAKFLGQGTLYPDVIESVSVKGPSHTIKTHHNVGGLPKKMDLQLIEPFRELFKDEVRKLGAQLGIPASILGRHPFPGPGLAVRILGPVTTEGVQLLRRADAIYMEELREQGLYEQIWQAFAVLLPVKAVGVMGDARTYENVVALRAVTSRDGMTADWFSFDKASVGKVANRIINEVRGINRVVYDISSKPPATIEWE